MKLMMFAFAALNMFVGAPALAIAIPRPSVCSQTWIPAPGIGHPFRGAVRNDDYGFKVTVPAGFTGWSGVAESAPFHGFMIYLDAARQSRINFEVHLRVDDNDAPIRPVGAKPVSFGDAVGWQTQRSGRVNGRSMLYVTAHFSHRQRDQVDDGSIQLITPSDQARATFKTYKKFVGSLDFDKRAQRAVRLRLRK
jgi:hypothetical protein